MKDLDSRYLDLSLKALKSRFVEKDHSGGNMNTGLEKWGTEMKGKKKVLLLFKKKKTSPTVKA